MTSRIVEVAGLRTSLFALLALCGACSCSEAETACGAASSCSLPSPDGGATGTVPEAGVAPAEHPDSGDTTTPVKPPAEPREAGTSDSGASASPLTLVDAEVPSAAYGSPFEFVLRHSGGTGAPRFTLKSGRLPKGAGLMSNGTLFGTPYEWGDYRFEVEVKAGDETVTREYEWRVTTTLMIAYLSDDREPGVQELFVANIGAGAPYAPVAVARADDFFWLGDGTTIHVVKRSSGETAISLVEIKEGSPGTPRELWRGESDCVGVWSPDETQYAVKCGDTIDFITREGLGVRNSIRTADPLGSFSWSPDSSKLWLQGDFHSETFLHGVAASNAKGDIKLIPAVLSEPSWFSSSAWSPDSRQLVLSMRTKTGSKHEQYLVDTGSQLSLLNPVNVNADSSLYQTLYAGWLTDGRLAYAQGASPRYRVFARNHDQTVDFIDEFAYGDLQSLRLVKDDTLLYRYNSGGRAFLAILNGGSAGDVIGDVVFSNDARKALVLVDGGSGQQLRVGTLPRLASQWLNAPSLGVKISAYSFSPDATRVSFTRESSGRFQTYYSDLRSGSGTAVPVDDASTSDPYRQYSPDTRFLASVVSNDGPIDLHLVDIRAQVAGAPVKVNGAGRVVRGPEWQPIWPLPR